MTQPQSPPEKSTTVPNFALLVEEKLSGLDKWNRIIDEKWIMDVLFEIEMSSHIKEPEGLSPQNSMRTSTPSRANIFGSATPYMDMLSTQANCHTRWNYVTAY